MDTGNSTFLVKRSRMDRPTVGYALFSCLEQIVVSLQSSRERMPSFDHGNNELVYFAIARTETLFLLHRIPYSVSFVSSTGSCFTFANLPMSV